VPSVGFWAALALVPVVAFLVRALTRRPLSTHVLRLGRLDLALVVVTLLALGFHCAAMFFPTAASAVPLSDGAAEAIRELGTASQTAYWLPVALLVLALRRAWTPLLVAEVGVLLAVGITMFWSFSLTAHLATIAGSVVVTAAVLTTATYRPVVLPR
jgi:hypothetical protein